MVAVNMRNLFSAIVLSTLLIQCFGAAAGGVNTNLTEHDVLDKNASSVKSASILPSSPRASDVVVAAAVVVKDNSTEHGALDKNASFEKAASVLSSSHGSASGVNGSSTEHDEKPAIASRPTLRGQYRALKQNVSTVKPAGVASPSTRANGTVKLSNDGPSSRSMFDDADEYDYSTPRDTIGHITGDPGLPPVVPLNTTTKEISSTAAVPANTSTTTISSTSTVPGNTTKASSTATVPVSTSTTKVSSTATVPGSTTTKEVSSSTATMPGSTSTTKVSSTATVPGSTAETSSTGSTSSRATKAGDLAGDKDGSNSTADPLTDSTTPDGNGASASLTTTAFSLILVASVNFLFV